MCFNKILKDMDGQGQPNGVEIKATFYNISVSCDKDNSVIYVWERNSLHVFIHKLEFDGLQMLSD